jgi:hypothetical protein
MSTGAIRGEGVIGVMARILAKNPSILIVLGAVLHVLQDGLGIWMITAGILLNILWLTKGRFW